MPFPLRPQYQKALKTCALLTTGFALLLPRCPAAPATLEIDLNSRGHEIPRSLFGLMTEEINYSYDGGLYAELIRNRTFQDPASSSAKNDFKPASGHAPRHWSAIGQAAISTNTEDPVTAALPVNLRLSLKGNGGVANDGFWGIPVRPSTTYTATFYARGKAGFAPRIAATLSTEGDDRVVAQAQTAPLGGTWQKYTLRLTTPADAPTTAKARFVLSASGEGDLEFSFISLFPPTYQDAPNGLRPDLMKLMAGMKPAFIRLPGGNYLEGNRFSDRFAWKKMIGPVESRPGHMGCWGYRSSDGMGLPEFLLWCRQLGAEPVLGLFAGYTLNGDYARAGSPEMDLYTQEALEEIEYLIGPAESTWGRRRVADGFAEPFALHYVEIGNEDFFDASGSYDGRFAQMAKAIRAKYPALKIISTMPVSSFKPDLVDDHSYAGASSMIRQGTRYDSERTDTKVFMGEWATQGGQPTPNLQSALSDAVFAMGLERNSDHVVMQCYAPLLANVNREDAAKGHPQGWQWGTNLIGYDALNSFGSPSYHVLATFAQNTGDVTVASKLEVPLIERSVATQGLVGVGSYQTSVEYTDLRVTTADGKTLSDKNLILNPEVWSFPNGAWSASNGVLRSPPNVQQTWATVGDKTWKDCTITVRARKLGGDEGFIVLWHAKGTESYRWWNIGGWGNTLTRCEAAEGESREPFGPSTPFTVENNRWYDLRLEVRGASIRGFVDGKLVLESTDTPPAPTPSAFATASYVRTSEELVVKVVNTAPAPMPVHIEIKGASSLGKGRALVISGNPTDVNSLEHPELITPKEESLPAAATAFEHSFPPYSVSVLRFPAKK